MSKTLWHPAFCGAMQLELIDYRDVLEFQDEYQLTKGPLRVDILIIKKIKNVIIAKNIARLFLRYNLIEYKSPDDTLDIYDFYKIHSLKLYYAYRKKINADNISITMVSSTHPYKLLKHLSRRHKVTSDNNGIYVIDHEMRPTQIVVLSELPKEQNLWLTNLNKELTAVRLQHLLTGVAEHSKKHNNDDVVLDAYLNVVAEANIEKFQEIIMKDTIIQCLEDVGYVDKFLKDRGYIDKWRTEGRVEGRVEGEAEGRAKTVIRILSRRLGVPSKPLQKKICSIRNIAKLDELTDFALTCVSLKEFATALK
jgi:hypothetical protein